MGPRNHEASVSDYIHNRICNVISFNCEIKIVKVWFIPRLHGCDDHKKSGSPKTPIATMMRLDHGQYYSGPWLKDNGFARSETNTTGALASPSGSEGQPEAAGKSCRQRLFS